MLGGALEIHPADEALHESSLYAGGAGPEGDSYAPEAVHPREAHHFEAGLVVHHPACPACLLHLLNGGAHTPEQIGVAPTLAVATLAASVVPAHGRLVVADGAARAPPLA